jgi:hypothetical protein
VALAREPSSSDARNCVAACAIPDASALVWTAGVAGAAGAWAVVGAAAVVGAGAVVAMVVGLAALLVSAGRGAVVAGGGADCVGAAVCVVLDAQAAINQLVPPNAASRKACRRVSLAIMAILLCRPAPMSRMLLDGRTDHKHPS